jgi:hypothetical protein
MFSKSLSGNLLFTLLLGVNENSPNGKFKGVEALLKPLRLISDLNSISISTF